MSNFRKTLRAAVFFCALLLSGCSNAFITDTVAPLAVVYTVAFKELPTDTALSVLTGKSCNTVRASADGGAICRDLEKERSVAARPEVYCYRTLGAIDCYNAPRRKDDLAEIR